MKPFQFLIPQVRVFKAACLWPLLCLPTLLPVAALAEEVSLMDADGWLDASEFLDTAYGFMPFLAPITEPAVGYGAAAALVFIDRNAPDQNGQYVRPDIAMVGGMATENGSEGQFAGHLGSWMDGRLRTLVGVANMDVNLEFFGLGGQHNPGDGVNYSIGETGGVFGGSYRLLDSGWFAGLRYLTAKTEITLESERDRRLGLIPEDDRELELGALTPTLSVDKRNNFFTPTQGWYLDLSVPLYRESLGSSRDFETATLLGMWFQPLSSEWYVAARGGLKASSDATPFFLRPFVWLRGVQALAYQGEQVAETELEVRWQFHPRFSAVAFGGAGTVRSDGDRGDDETSVTAGGAGFRYLMARKYGLHMGMDLAFGPDDPVIYFVFGSTWLRP
jgi:hypothetical protein